MRHFGNLENNSRPDGGCRPITEFLSHFLICASVLVFFCNSLVSQQQQRAKPFDWAIISGGTLAEVELQLTMLPKGSLSLQRNNGLTPLMHAARYNPNIGVTKILVEHGESVNKKTSEGMTPLMLAARYNSETHVMQSLVKLKSKINAQSADGRTALMYAAEFSRGEFMIKSLIDSGAKVKLRDALGEDALMKGCKGGRMGKDLVHLIEKGAAYKAKNKEGYTALLLAAANGSYSALTVLLDAGANPNAKTKQGDTVLHFAAANLPSSILNRLVSSKAKVSAKNKNGMTPLMFAASSTYHYSNITTLINLGANVNSFDNAGRTALMIAASGNTNEEAIDVFITSSPGMDIDKKSKDKNARTALMFALSQNPNEDMALKLISHGADINARDKNGNTPLIIAASNRKSLDLLFQLRMKGADLSRVNKGGDNVLLAAIRRNASDEIIKYLILINEDINHTNKKGESVLLVAAKFSTKESDIFRFIEAGARIDAVTRQGYSLWDLIAENAFLYSAESLWGLHPHSDKNLELLRLSSASTGLIDLKKVVDEGAHLEVRDGIGRTPLMLALLSENGDETVKALLDLGANVSALSSSGSSLMMAARNCDKPSIIELLVEAGADINYSSHDGLTLLMIAARYNKNTAIVDKLIELGANISARDNYSRSALYHSFYNDPLVRAKLKVKLAFETSQQSSLAVEAGLRWLCDHQSQSGFWDADEFMYNDVYPEKPQSDGHGNPVVDVGLTGLCLLAVEHSSSLLLQSKMLDASGTAINFLFDIMDKEGLFGEEVGHPTLYNQAIAILALDEACDSYDQSPLRKSMMEKAVQVLIKAQNPYKAWRYELEPNNDNDSSITGWIVRALKTAKENNVDIDNAVFDGAENWFAEMTDLRTGRTGYAFYSAGDRTVGPGTRPARTAAMLDRFPTELSESITAIALLSRILMTDSAKVTEWADHSQYERLKKQAELIHATLPKWDESDGSIDMYYWYYGTLAMKRWGGSLWKDWRKAILKALIPNQRREDKEDNYYGSWDPIGAWGMEGGRVYSTVICTLILEECGVYAD
jgi:ankyrin repeat protein